MAGRVEDAIAAFRAYARVGLSPGLDSAMLGLAELRPAPLGRHQAAIDAPPPVAPR